MTPASLESYSAKDLAQLAKKRGVQGWHSMRKEQLVRALLKSPKAAAPSRRSPDGRKSAASSNGAKPESAKKPSSPRRDVGSSPVVAKSNGAAGRIGEIQDKLQRAKNISTIEENGPAKRPARDRLVVMVRDPYWLHAYWELARKTIDRVQAAMGQHWHTARPVLRLYEVGESSMASSETLLRTIDIHGGVSNWYIDVADPPNSYRLEIGYLAADGRFHSVARSNVVTTPTPSARDVLDENWTDVAKNYDRIYAMSGGYSRERTSRELQELLEERLRRPMGLSAASRYGAGAQGFLDGHGNFEFHVDAEMIVFGATRPGAQITLSGEPVRLREDGTFTVRLNMPDRRQVIPVVARSADGSEQRTIVIAVERNTKTMEPLTRDPHDEG